MHRIGLDIGSTTIKTVVLDETGHVCHTQYERHFSRIAEKAREVLLALGKNFPENTDSASQALPGSA